ncbi:MAG: hypothetical protein D6737_06050 [Chloroflexi bacterium]|nr:MAG: hypothetical protein D6737_06050 [Chloroflexota bacterium]
MAIQVYITTSCALVPPTLNILDELGVDYVTLDVDAQDDARERLRELTGGFLSVPTLEFEDGSVMIEPNLFKLRITLLHL